MNSVSLMWAMGALLRATAVFRVKGVPTNNQGVMLWIITLHQDSILDVGEVRLLHATGVYGLQYMPKNASWRSHSFATDPRTPFDHQQCYLCGTQN